MKIEKLILENIRSYKSEIIEFPTGSTLLMGDIGSGKSTILLSIEFALFGFRRTDLFGSALLRHGEINGSVELRFQVEEKKVIIKRVLKKTQNSIKQEAGYIIIDDIKQDLTAVELKSKILELLGYPEDLLTKTKESIYRYTVYTPQEAMKHIVFADTQERLDILRRVFGIDKYKRIKENLVIYIRETKKKIAYYQGHFEGLDDIVKELNKLIQDSNQIKDLFEKSKKESDNSKIKLDEKSTELKEYKKILVEHDSIQKKLDLNNQKIQQLSNLNRKYDEQVKELKIKFEIEKKSIEGKSTDVSKLQKFIDELNDKSKELELKKSEMIQKYAVINSKIKDSKALSEKVLSLQNCPMCMQGVSHEHKDSIRKDSIKILEESKEKIFKIEETLKKINSNLKIISEKNTETREKLNEIKSTELIKKSLLEKENQVIRLNKETIENESSKSLFQKENKELQEILSKSKTSIEKLELLEKDEIILREKHQTHLLEKTKYEEKLKNFDKEKESFTKRINQKESSKKKYEKLNSYHQILESKGLPLIGLMEKQVMGTIHYEFNNLLSKWFNLLIDEDLLSIRIDQDFNPILEQNGYETTIDNLSGGEKTAVALSYRLALNQVINDLINTIKTKDFLILDEPTDGFSSEQLDKLKDVIEELNIEQLILVSHDSKIEGFVDNHINIIKKDHESEITTL